MTLSMSTNTMPTIKEAKSESTISEKYRSRMKSTNLTSSGVTVDYSKSTLSVAGIDITKYTPKALFPPDSGEDETILTQKSDHSSVHLGSPMTLSMSTNTMPTIKEAKSESTISEKYRSRMKSTNLTSSGVTVDYSKSTLSVAGIDITKYTPKALFPPDSGEDETILTQKSDHSSVHLGSPMTLSMSTNTMPIIKEAKSESTISEKYRSRMKSTNLTSSGVTRS